MEVTVVKMNSGDVDNLHGHACVLDLHISKGKIVGLFRGIAANQDTRTNNLTHAHSATGEAPVNQKVLDRLIVPVKGVPRGCAISD